MTDDVVNLMTFVPAKDYGLSTKFYLDLGFTLNWESDEVKEFEVGGFAFLLQNFYVIPSLDDKDSSHRAPRLARLGAGGACPMPSCNQFGEHRAARRSTPVGSYAP